MKTRKQGSTELFQGGPLFDENGVADLTGSTLTIKMRDQYGAIVINDLPATPVLPSSWTYAPVAGDVANYGTFQIEITETKASGKVVRYPQSGYEPFVIEPKLDAIYVPPPTNPVNGSIGLILMASQTPGAVLLYDASGNAIAYAPSATPYSVLMNNGTGLPPTWQGAPAALGSRWMSNGASLPPSWKSAYLGAPGMRAFVPSSTGGTLLNMMSKSRHQVSDDVAAVQFAIPNWAGNGEAGPGAATTATATIEFETGRRWRMTLAGNPSMAIPDGGMIWTDPIPWMVPRGTWFNFYLYRTNAVGCPYTANAQDHALGELIEYNIGVDKTASGVIDPTQTAPWAGPCGIRGLMIRPSVGIMGDSIAFGQGDTTDGSGAIGAFARVLQAAGIAWTNLAIGGTGANGFLSGSHAYRVELASLCTHLIQEYGTNDLALGDAQMRADLIAINALMPASQKKYLATMTPRTTSTDAWATIGNQTVTAFQAVIDSNNTWRKTVPSGFAGCFDVGSTVQSGSTGKWLAPGYTADGLHPTAAGYAAIVASGVVTPGSFTT